MNHKGTEGTKGRMKKEDGGGKRQEVRGLTAVDKISIFT